MSLINDIMQACEVLVINLLLTVKLVHSSLKVLESHFRSVFPAENMMLQDLCLLLQGSDVIDQRCFEHPLNVVLRINNGFD